MYALTPLKKAVFPVLVSSFLADLGHIHMGLRAKASKNPPDHALKRHSLRLVSSVTHESSRILGVSLGEEAKVGRERRAAGISRSREVTDPFMTEGRDKTRSTVLTESDARGRKERGSSGKGPGVDPSGQEVA